MLMLIKGTFLDKITDFSDFLNVNPWFDTFPVEKSLSKLKKSSNLVWEIPQ
jgi:hypothetical protein